MLVWYEIHLPCQKKTFFRPCDKFAADHDVKHLGLKKCVCLQSKQPNYELLARLIYIKPHSLL